jgi:hypothetical protein
MERGLASLKPECELLLLLLLVGQVLRSGNFPSPDDYRNATTKEV